MDNDKRPEMFSAANATDHLEAHPKVWIAAYTRTRSEKKAANELRNLGIETYLPIQRQIRNWSDRKKMVEVPVIPMILFAHISSEEMATTRNHHLIRHLLTLPGNKEVASIPEYQIENLKLMLGQSEIPVEFESGQYSTGDRVRVVRGTLKGLSGRVKEINDDTTTVWVAVDLLGGAVIKLRNVEIELETEP